MTIPPAQVHGAPIGIIAEAGLVIMDDAGVAVTMTADCADETGHRLITAAEQARGQAPQSST